MVQVLGKEVGSTGYGLMGLTWFAANYSGETKSIDDAITAMKAAYDQGLYLWSGAEFYGNQEYNSMTIIKEYFTRYPEHADKVVIAIKGGINLKTLAAEGWPERTRESINNILTQLGGKKSLDIWVPSRRDTNVPLADTFKVAQEFIDAGKLGAVALSEITADDVEEGAKAAKIALAEVEVSMFTPDIYNNGVADACAKHDIPVMAYSPIGRGMLTGTFSSREDFKGMIKQWPRFSEENFQHNYQLVTKTKELAEKKGCTPAQLALAWIRSQSKRNGRPAIIPIPGSTSPSRIAENAKEVDLTEEEVGEITKVVEEFEPLGGRYPSH